LVLLSQVSHTRILTATERFHPEKRILLKHQNYIVYDEVIGRGTYSKVYLGWDLSRNISVAVKEISEMEEN
jgi:serine/threonine protein kinase